MDFVTVPASGFSLSELVLLLNRGFEGYFIPIHFSTEMLANMLHKDGINLADSRVLIADDQTAGIALIAGRASLRTSRLAAMGIAKEVRGMGAGSWLMKKLIEEARQRGDREMVLEVIEQNEPAVKLYDKCGFKSVRRLVGYAHSDKNTDQTQHMELEEIDLDAIQPLISQYGLPDLPWQLSGESVAQMKPRPHAYRHEQAYLVITSPESEHVIIWSLLVEPKARGNGLGTKMLKDIVACYPEKTWHVPAIFPEELGHVFERAGFEKEPLSQWQMRLTL